jgi:hypothetical protein
MTAPLFTTLTHYHYAKVMDWLTGLIADLKGAAVKVLIRIAKWTFGFRKWEDKIALSQFEQACGLNHDTVIDTIADLLTLKLIRRARAGNSYRYALCLPDGLFVEKPTSAVDNSVENNFEVIHTHSAQVSFFTQNQGTSPQNEEQMVGFSDTQIKDVTENSNQWNRLSEILTALTDINATAPRATYALRHLPRWAKRAATLGMGWGDVWSLWQACRRIGRNPIALFIHRLMDDGLPPTGTPPRRLCNTKLLFAMELE